MSEQSKPAVNHTVLQLWIVVGLLVGTIVLNGVFDHLWRNLYRDNAAFVHCRLMDLERGQVTHNCKLGE